MTDIQGRCPACRGNSLFLGEGGHVTCARLECPNPSAADELLHGTHDATRLTAELRVATAELQRLSAGEEPGYAEGAVPTPGQWIWNWNRASADQRLDVAQRVIDNADRASTCFLMAHEKRLAEDRQAVTALARVRKAIDSVKAVGRGHTPTTPYDKGVASAVDWVVMRVLEAVDARLIHGQEKQPAPLTDASGRTVCTCTLATACGCGTSIHYDTPPCAGFPDRCPNPMDVPAQSPYHGGGVRCGCGDRKEKPTEGVVCAAYHPPTTAEMTGLCARCGMYDYKHQQQP